MVCIPIGTRILCQYAEFRRLFPVVTKTSTSKTVTSSQRSQLSKGGSSTLHTRLERKGRIAVIFM